MGRKAVLGMMLTLLLIGILTMAFSIQPTEADKEPQLILDTDKDIYILGENVTITLRNIGSETVEIGGYPAWTIFTYPGEEPVYPMIFTWLAWSLEPRENDTFTWNQYNEYTQSPVEPGMYVVRDTQGWALSAYFKIIVLEEEWIPYVPDPKEVDLAFWMVNETAYVNVTITFGDPCVYISDWGTVTKVGYDIWVDLEIWHWTGGCILIIWPVSHTYELGYLEIDNYTFTFKAWGNGVKSINFAVTEADQEPWLLLETDKDTYILGENVTITFTNGGNETVYFSGYPPFIISDQQGVVVAPVVQLAVIVEVPPGGSLNWRWNQLNGFLIPPKLVPAGNYTITVEVYDSNWDLIATLSTSFEIGTDIMPEFPSAIILPLFMIFSIIAVIFKKRGFPRKPKNQLLKPIFLIYPFLGLSFCI